MNLTRKQILSGEFNLPNDFIKLRPTKHFLERLDEREVGIQCIPTLVKVTKDNIHSGRTNDGKRLDSVVIRINYNKFTFMFIALSPIDGAVKTLWFKDKKNDNRRSLSVHRDSG